MPEILHTTKRENLGSRACKRLRQQGQIPAVIYGHGEANVNLALQAAEVDSAIRRGSRVVEVTGAVNDSAFFRDIQWDALGSEVVHIDLTRVSAEETVEVQLPIELRGEAPGTKEGGVVSSPRRSIAILCPAGAIPEKILISVNDLHLGQAIKAGDLALPENAQLASDPEAVVVQCIEIASEEDDDAAVPGAGEPEVIGQKPEEEGIAGEG
jgi:large subunit ribosomal protein L25